MTVRKLWWRRHARFGSAPGFVEPDELPQRRSRSRPPAVPDGWSRVVCPRQHLVAAIAPPSAWWLVALADLRVYHLSESDHGQKPPVTSCRCDLEWTLDPEKLRNVSRRKRMRATVAEVVAESTSP